MKTNNFKNVDLNLYYEKLPNGLDVYIVPKKNTDNHYVTFTSKFGSSTLEFIPYGKNEYISVPPGVAHFLEHKVFSQKDNIDPFTFYTNNGADCNANTSNNKTCYLFSGPTKFVKNLNYLLDFVQDPYFTDSNVLKEKGIIKQEIKMYDDMPYWKMYDKIMANIFINHPLKHPVAGKVSDILKITKETLYDCYNTFYQPHNMFIVVTGNVDPEKTINVISKNQNKKKFLPKQNIVVKDINEPDQVEVEKEIVKFNVNIPKVAIAYKINILNYDINELNLYFNTLFDIKFGSTSILNEKLKSEHLITDTIEYETVLTKKHIVYIFFVETNYIDKIIKIFDDEFKNLNVNEEEVERKKKLLKSIVQFRSDNIYDINHKIINNIIKFNKVIFDDYEIIDNMTSLKINNMTKKLDFSYKSIIIMKK